MKDFDYRIETWVFRLLLLIVFLLFIVSVLFVWMFLMDFAAFGWGKRDFGLTLRTLSYMIELWKLVFAVALTLGIVIFTILRLIDREGNTGS